MQRSRHECSRSRTAELHGAPGTTRTCDARFRKPTLYPLSYGGWDIKLLVKWSF